MQNLRDKLLKAGLVSEKQAQEAARDQRQGPARSHRQREKALTDEEQQRLDKVRKLRESRAKRPPAEVAPAEAAATPAAPTA